jgi:hypothetical protein
MMKRGSIMSESLDVGWVFIVVVLWLGLSGCEKTQAGPVVVEASLGENVVKAVIGKEGGTLKFVDTGAKLIVPPKLLQEEVTIGFKRESPSLDLSKKDFVGKAYRVSPRLTFAPGAAKLFIPIDKPLPGLPADINLRIYYYERLESYGPGGPGFVHEWQPHPVSKFSGFSQNRKFLVFDVYETISDRSTKPPFGLLQAAFDLP